MLNFSGNRRIFLARSPIDMRKGAGSLATLVEHDLGMDAYVGDIFIFMGRHNNRVKVLAWDQSGFWLCAKRLERGTFAIPANTVGPTHRGTAPLSPAEVHLLLEGIQVHRATYHAHYHRPEVVPDTPTALVTGVAKS